VDQGEGRGEKLGEKDSKEVHGKERRRPPEKVCRTDYAGSRRRGERGRELAFGYERISPIRKGPTHRLKKRGEDASCEDGKHPIREREAPAGPKFFSKDRHKGLRENKSSAIDSLRPRGIYKALGSDRGILKGRIILRTTERELGTKP